MKERYISATDKRVVIGAVIELIVATITIFLLVTKTAPPFINATWGLITYWIVIFILAFSSSLFFIAFCSILIVGVCLNYYFNRREQQAKKKIKSILSHEFKPVKLKNKEILPNVLDDSTISCRAKLDENDEIVFKISVIAAAKGHTNDYSYFLENFSID